METKKVGQTKYINNNALIGVVTRWVAEESYIFVATNNFLINLPQIKAPIVKTYINNKDLMDRELIKQDDLITFKLKELSRYGQLSAKEARRITPTKEDFQLIQNYINNGQSKIEGILQTKSGSLHINADIAQFTTNLFYKNKEVRDLVIKHLIQENRTDFDTWKQIFDNMTEEERNTFDFSQLNLTVPLKILIYSYTEDSDLIDLDEIEEFCKTNSDAFVHAVKSSLNDDVQYQLFDQMSDNFAISIITTFFKGTTLMDKYIEDKWEKQKGTLPYTVFDFISDGENISEFCVISEGYPRSYEGEEQLESLFCELQQQIIVAHNCKLLHLPLLQNKGLNYDPDTFIWDTLEIELLLTPLHYTYSLEKKDTARDKAQLVNELFWNQLYRLSQQPELVQDLKDFLPKQINNIIELLQKDYFANHFLKTADTQRQFFPNKLLTPTQEYTDHINKIKSIPVEEPVLIIAPRTLWPRLALDLPLTFHNSDDSFKVIDIEKLKLHPFLNPLKQKILERFCHESQTPIIENLPFCLRPCDNLHTKITYSDEDLEPLLTINTSHIDCIDFTGFDEKTIQDKNYAHIFAIGEELLDRNNRFKVCNDKTFNELIQIRSTLPFTMATTKFAPIPKKEFKKLNIPTPPHTSNLWAERLHNGNFAFYINYDYRDVRKKFLKNFKVKATQVKWQLAEMNKNDIHITHIQADKSELLARRVNYSSTNRSVYWLFQMTILKNIHNNNPELPIIYVISDSEEISALRQYAKGEGFYLSDQQDLVERIETVSDHSNGMVIMTKDQFVNTVGMYRTDKPFCYVYDSLDIERCMLMWSNLPFENDIEAAEDIERDDNIKCSTPRQCVHALWPLLQHYCSLVKANNLSSTFFIIDTYLDNYPDLLQSCNAQTFQAVIPSDFYFEQERDKADRFFSDLPVLDDIDNDTAIDIIRPMFIGQYQWREEQLPILHHMLDKKGDCLISMPTGGGKSVLFQAPAIVRATIMRRLSIVIAPLRALMQDQVEELYNKGFQGNVDYINSDRTFNEIQDIYCKIRSGELALLYITPERFRVKSFIDTLQQRMELDGGLEYVVFDEAHCVSQWGQEFRPDYINALEKCITFRQVYGYKLMIAFFSATVSAQIENDLNMYFDKKLTRLGQLPQDTNPVRQHIQAQFKTIITTNNNGDSIRVEEIVKFINSHNIDFSKSRLLIFCRRKRQCQELTDKLESFAKKAAESTPDLPLAQCVGHINFYHAGLDATIRNDIYDRFKRETSDEEPLYVLCATKAFGMGMDIPNVHYVIHYSPPEYLEDYLQEVGRAGRDLKSYKDTFQEGERLPALCLVDQDDFAKSKKMLIENLLAVDDLEEARREVCKYIEQFQTINETHENPIIVPYDFWTKKNDRFVDQTSGRLALYWLEQMNKIKQGYTELADLNIKLLNRDLKILNNQVYQYILERVNHNNRPTPLAIKDMRKTLRMSLPKIMNQIIELRGKNAITVDEEITCEIHERRHSETQYTICNLVNKFTLRVVFSGVCDLLSGCSVGVAYRLGTTEREGLVGRLLENHHNEDEYMPWHNATKKSEVNFDVQKRETWEKEIRRRSGWKVFDILRCLPMVRVKEEKEDDETGLVITLKENNWRSYLGTLESDCLTMLKEIYEEKTIYWVNTINKFGWLTKGGFSYFMNVLQILKSLSYIRHTPVLRSGVEVWTNDQTQIPIMEPHTDQASEISDQERKEVAEEETPTLAKFGLNENIQKLRLACMTVFADIESEEDRSVFIQRYFSCNDTLSYLKLASDYVRNPAILSEINEEALVKEEEIIKGNAQQFSIYQTPSNENVNVLAGPGSGKTHVLTLRCAKLIYRGHVQPDSILVLAYNRSVVEELRNRLNNLFSGLGLGKMMRLRHVYTFHGLAKLCLGDRLNNVETDKWEGMFLKYLQDEQSNFCQRFQTIRHILVDEFQDITESRLQSLVKIHEIFPNATFFTIGDINQSIYGYDRVGKDVKAQLGIEQYAEKLDPKPYYKRFSELLSPKQMTMVTNYRSYPKILEAASKFIAEGEVPVSSDFLRENEPKEDYVFEIDTTKKGEKKWYEKLQEIIAWAQEENVQAKRTEVKHRSIKTIAVFFRTNNEVYRGYSQIKDKLPSEVRLRIQGKSVAELWREREIYHLIDYLGKKSENLINEQTGDEIKEYISNAKTEHPNWDRHLLDVANILAMYYIDSLHRETVPHTYGDMQEAIKEIASYDDGGQVYKIYDSDNYASLREEEQLLTVVLTTMHKVKGLEFDVVVIPPSFASLPLKRRRQYKENETPWADDMADINEERRLMYVAYTRAKKRLYVYKWNREKALENRQVYDFPDKGNLLRYTEKEPELKNYTIYYTAQDKRRLNQNIEAFDYIRDNVKKDDPVTIIREQYQNFKFYVIFHNGVRIGQLSLTNSELRSRMFKDNVEILEGLFVSNIFVWTYDETVAADQNKPSTNNKKNMASQWSDISRERGYTYVVHIAGFGEQPK